MHVTAFLCQNKTSDGKQHSEASGGLKGLKRKGAAKEVNNATVSVWNIWRTMYTLSEYSFHFVQILNSHHDIQKRHRSIIIIIIMVIQAFIQGKPVLASQKLSSDWW